MDDGTHSRLLVVTPRYPPLTGGVEHHVREVARRVSGAFEVTVLTTDRTGELPSEEVLDGVSVVRVPAWPKERDYYVAPAIYRLVARGGWDVMHLQSYHTAVAPLALLAAIGADVPFVVTFHGGGHSSTLRTMLRGPQRAMLRPLLSHAEKLVAVAEFEAAFFSAELGIPRERFVVIPNGSDLPAPSATTAVEPAGRGPVLTSIGRLERYKGHHRIVAAMPFVLEREPLAELRIIGAGPYGDRIRRLAERLGVSDSVHVRSIPASDRAAMASAIAESSLIVSMSEFETHPLSIIEALALGRPALVADTSGLRELAERGLATSVPPATPPALLAEAIVHEFRHPRPVPHIDLPTWEGCADALASVYRQVACAHHPAVGSRAGAMREA